MVVREQRKVDKMWNNFFAQKKLAATSVLLFVVLPVVFCDGACAAHECRMRGASVVRSC